MTSNQPAGGQGASGAAVTSALPIDAQAVIGMLKELGVTEFEPRVINQLLDFVYGYTKEVLEESRGLANHAGHKQVKNQMAYLKCINLPIILLLPD